MPPECDYDSVVKTFLANSTWVIVMLSHSHLFNLARGTMLWLYDVCTFFPAGKVIGPRYTLGKLDVRTECLMPHASLSEKMPKYNGVWPSWSVKSLRCQVPEAQIQWRSSRTRNDKKCMTAECKPMQTPKACCSYNGTDLVVRVTTQVRRWTSPVIS